MHIPHISKREQRRKKRTIVRSLDQTRWRRSWAGEDERQTDSRMGDFWCMLRMYLREKGAGEEEQNDGRKRRFGEKRWGTIEYTSWWEKKDKMEESDDKEEQKARDDTKMKEMVRRWKRWHEAERWRRDQQFLTRAHTHIHTHTPCRDCEDRLEYHPRWHLW